MKGIFKIKQNESADSLMSAPFDTLICDSAVGQGDVPVAHQPPGNLGMECWAIRNMSSRRAEIARVSAFDLRRPEKFEEMTSLSIVWHFAPIQVNSEVQNYPVTLSIIMSQTGATLSATPNRLALEFARLTYNLVKRSSTTPVLVGSKLRTRVQSTALFSGAVVALITLISAFIVLGHLIRGNHTRVALNNIEGLGSLIAECGSVEVSRKQGRVRVMGEGGNTAKFWVVHGLKAEQRPPVESAALGED